jgi:hypothetical protein
MYASVLIIHNYYDSELIHTQNLRLALAHSSEAVLAYKYDNTDLDLQDPYSDVWDLINRLDDLPIYDPDLSVNIIQVTTINEMQ